MNNKLVNFIVLKYLKFDKTNPFISITSILAFIGVCIGVMVLIISMAIMNGTAKEFKDKLFIMNYPLSIHPIVKGAVNKDILVYLEKEFPYLKFSPYISSQVIIQNDDYMKGGILFGVDKNKEKLINPIYKKAIENIEIKSYDIILGSGISSDMILNQDSKILLYFTRLNPNGFSMLPTMKKFVYKNSFRSGLNTYDQSYMYTTIESLQNILNKDNSTYDGIHIYSDDSFNDIAKLKKSLEQFNVLVVGWWEQNGNFFSAMQMEKKALFIILMLIILVASLNIISSLLMTVMSRRKEIALLLSMGSSKKEIMSIFMKLGIIIGFSGIIMGLILGFFGIYILDNYNIISLPKDVYGTSKLPILLSNIDLFSIVIGSVIIVIISSYYPAVKSTKINVIDVLRNE